MTRNGLEPWHVLMLLVVVLVVGAVVAVAVATRRRPATELAVPAGAVGGTNGLAIASLVLGVLWLMGVGSLLALVFGYVARAQIRRTGEGGNGLAVAGIVLGWVGVVLPVLAGLLLVATTGVGGGTVVHVGP